MWGKRGVNLITIRQYNTRTAPKRLHEARGTWFIVEQTKSGSFRSYWLFRYQIDGRRRDRTLVPTDLPSDRKILGAWRELVSQGIDPLEIKSPTKGLDVMTDPPQSRSPTFKEVANQCKEIRIANSRAKRGRGYFVNRMEAYVFPKLGSSSVDEIETPDILKVIEPIWQTKNRTAEKCLSDIAYVLGYAQAKGLYRRGALPTAWKHNLEYDLPKKSSFHEVEHYAAMKYEEIPDFIAQLNTHDSITASFVHFCILSGVRNGTVRLAEWGEFDLNKLVWNIPQTKNGKPWTVPLTHQMISILDKARPFSGDTYVFPQKRDSNKPVSENCGNSHLHKVWGFPVGSVTMHGFRSSLSEYLNEETTFSKSRIEQTIEHQMGDPVEEAYNRRQRLNRRLETLEAWNDYCWDKINGARR